MEPESSMNSLKLARETWKKKDRVTIARANGIEPTHPVLDSLLATAAQYRLDPLLGHLWLVDDSMERIAKDGDPRSDDEELRVGITRDGLLVVARRDPRFGGMRFDVVRTEDTFKVRHSEEGKTLITHEYPDLPDLSVVDGEADDYRGPVVGAYCQTFVEGQIPTYYFAWLREHGQFDSNDDLAGTWATYLSAMIIKAAQSVTLRLAFGVTGVVGVDELKHEPSEESPPREGPPDPTPFLLDLDLPTEVKDPLVDMIAAANDAKPNAWSLAKLQMRLSSDDPELLKKAAGDVIAELEAEAKRRPESAAA